MVVGVFAITVDPVLLLNVAGGVQVNELALLAVIATVLPAQTLGLVTVIVGLGIIRTVYIAEAEHVPFDPITVIEPMLEGGMEVIEMKG